jgi:hypothetical protein
MTDDEIYKYFTEKDLQNMPKAKGLTESSINQMQKEVYIKSTTGSGKDDTCNICLEEFQEGESIRMLPC